MMSRYAEIHTVLWCQSLQTLCACKYFEARVTTLVVSMHLEPQFLTCTCVLPLLFPANRYYPCQLFHFDQGTNAEIQCRRGHIDLGDRGKHLPGVDGNSACGGVEHGAKLGFFVSLWDDYLFQLKKLHCFTGSAIKYLDGKCMEMECHMLSLPVQGAQRSSSLAVHKSPTL